MKEGAVVVLDAEQGDVIAMVSRPFYDPSHVNVKDGSWSNRAVKAATPGSIYKLVVAAAALEEHVTSPDEVFHCSGHYDKYGLACWKTGGHGDITLSEGFAKSCNVVFATLGERLSAESISKTAHKLGLNEQIGWHDKSFLDGSPLYQMDQEEAGRTFYDMSKVDGGALAQTAIGQRDVLMTPLQAANLVVTLLNQGEVYSPRLVSTILFKDGSTLADLPAQKYFSKEGKIQPKTAKLLLSWMRQVVTDGTGRTLVSAKWPLAGKSGTAQVIHNGEARNNQWFIGYGPVGKPKFAVAVLSQNRPTHSEHQAIEIFRSTMNILERHFPK
ncbi:Penicillin-binding protein 4B [compost metagenome]